MPTITLARYFLDRLENLGIDCIFGVPGDYDLVFLDEVLAHPTIRWIGCVNELNAAYAADGWSRATGLPGVLCTVFGVGELSAINGVAGSFAESIPIIHLVGKPSTAVQKRKALVHHSISVGRYDQTTLMYSHISAAQALLTSIDDNDGKSATAEIDRVIRVCVEKSKPVYISLPMDLVFAQTSADPLKQKLDTKSIYQDARSRFNDHKAAEQAVSTIVDMYKNSSNPCLVVDFGVIRFHLREQVEQLVKAGDLAFFTTPLGKGALDEDHPNFKGVYLGTVSESPVQEQFDSADFVLFIGPLNSDLNTGSFTYKVPQSQRVDLNSEGVKVQDTEYPSLDFHVILPMLIKAFGELPKKGAMKTDSVPKTSSKVEGNPDEMVGQDAFWSVVSNTLKDGDIMTVDAGTSSFGILNTRMPKNVVIGSQTLWGSIGFAGGAILGAAYAAKSRGRRAVLFTGEGAWQETIQDLSTIIRLGLTPILFVINNDGYTVERMIRGPEQHYNNVPVWDWQGALKFMGAKEGHYKTYSIKTAGQLQDLLFDKKFQAAEVIQLVEVHMPKQDGPRALRVQIEQAAKAAQAAQK